MTNISLLELKLFVNHDNKQPWFLTLSIPLISTLYRLMGNDKFAKGGMKPLFPPLAKGARGI